MPNIIKFHLRPRCLARRRRWGALLACVLFPAMALAQGFGSQTPGGHGQPVYRVTHLGDDGHGSFRDAVSQGHRSIVFDVAGDIYLQGDILTDASFLTVDGTTAPAPGITVKNYGIIFGGTDVILRGFRVRNPRGCDTCDSFGNGLGLRGQRMVVDRVSLDGGGDQQMGINQGARDITVRWSIFGTGPAQNYALLHAAWSKGQTSSRVSIHHNLFIDTQYRNPQVKFDCGQPRPPDVMADIRNNLVWGFTAYGTSITKCATANLIKNYYQSYHCGAHAIELNTGGQAYTAGNICHNGASINDIGNQRRAYSAPPIGETDACSAALEILGKAGVRPLDAVDRRYIAQVRSLPGCDGKLPGAELPAPMNLRVVRE